VTIVGYRIVGHDLKMSNPATAVRSVRVIGARRRLHRDFARRFYVVKRRFLVR
jgi:hypothetical protein